MSLPLAVPNWSLRASSALRGEARSRLETLGLFVHDVSTDADHARTVTAFSGARVAEGVEAVGELFLPRIDLSLHSGAHPFIGALDVCPFVYAESEKPVDQVVAWLDAKGIPALRYEHSGGGALLPALRAGGLEGLRRRGIEPHPRWGASVVGRRDFLLAVNLIVPRDDLARARRVAAEIRALREAGNPMFAGVRALGLDLPGQGVAQVSLNLTRPDEASFDPVFLWVAARIPVLGTELVGVIHARHVPGATRLSFREAQIYPPRGLAP